MRLRRVVAHGVTVAYETTDGAFRVEHGLGGARYHGAPWVITPRSSAAEAWLYAAGERSMFQTLGEARGHLEGSVYAEPHGWAHHTEEARKMLASAAFARRLAMSRGDDPSSDVRPRG